MKLSNVSECPTFIFCFYFVHITESSHLCLCYSLSQKAWQWRLPKLLVKIMQTFWKFLQSIVWMKMGGNRGWNKHSSGYCQMHLKTCNNKTNKINMLKHVYSRHFKLILYKKIIFSQSFLYQQWCTALQVHGNNQVIDSTLVTQLWFRDFFNVTWKVSFMTQCF